VVPQKEYTLWIPEIDSVMSITKPFKNNQNCFANIMGLEVKTTTALGRNGEIERVAKVNNIAGVKIYPYGLSPKTSNFSDG
jgi:hypothetical protein